MRIAIIGLGYVGLPLAVELSKHFDVIGFDVDQVRINELKELHDRNNEVSKKELKKCNLAFCNPLCYEFINDISQCDIYIVTVPTPVTHENVPDLGPVKNATKMIAQYLSKGNLVIYESTVYPGVTEDVCVPILEESHLTHLKDFNVGYSPERINPGDKINTLTTTVKIVAGDTLKTLNQVDFIYSKITKTYKAQSIKVAEAAKVIENTQRDINIAFMNELSQIFSRLDIDTNDVIDAAASKWNFQPFRPGLVGGHCISVDPYYLSHKAASHGFIADVILSARRVNDSMSSFLVDQLIKEMTQNRLLGENVNVIIIGCTFKENVPDIRNSKVFKLVKLLRDYGIEPKVYDYLADEKECAKLGVNIINELAEEHDVSAVILAVPHDKYRQMGWKLITEMAPKKGAVVMDLKCSLNTNHQPEDITLWRP